MKKAWKRLGKSGIWTHDPNLTEIYFIKTQISIFFISKGRGGPWSYSISRGTLEFLFLGVEVSYLLSFLETRYLPWKFGKFANNEKKLKALSPGLNLH